MSLSTYAGLKASVATWATYTDLTAVIPDFVTWAQQEIGRRLRCSLLYARADVAVSTEFASQPANFGAIRTFRLDVSPRVVLKTASADSVEDLCANMGTGSYPSAVAIEGNQFHFGPLYSAASTGKLLYYAIPTALSADGDTNVVLTKYPYLYLYGALEALFRYKEDDNNADRYGAQFGALIESINALEAKDSMSGPVQSAPYAGGIV